MADWGLQRRLFDKYRDARQEMLDAKDPKESCERVGKCQRLRLRWLRQKEINMEIYRNGIRRRSERLWLKKRKVTFSDKVQVKEFQKDE